MHSWSEIWSDFENSRFVRPPVDPGVELHATIREERDGALISFERDERGVERHDRNRL